MAATNLFGNIININLFEDGNGGICRLIFTHLFQTKCCLFPVILSSYHRCGRRHYIRAVKMFDRKPLMLYIFKPLSLFDWIQKFFDQQELKKMYSVMPSLFNAVESCVVIINEKPWTSAKELCKPLEYGKATKT